MIDIELAYRRAARRWDPEALGRCYRDALDQAAQDAPLGEPTPVASLARAVPCVVRLAISTYALDVLPASGGADSSGEGLLRDLMTKVETSAAGGLLRCHRALQLDEERRGEAVDAWFPAIYDAAAERLASIAPSDEPPALSRCAQQAGDWVAAAIEALDGDGRQAAEAIVDALASLLVIWAIADQARGREGASVQRSPLQGPTQRPA